MTTVVATPTGWKQVEQLNLANYGGAFRLEFGGYVDSDRVGPMLVTPVREDGSRELLCKYFGKVFRIKASLVSKRIDINSAIYLQDLDAGEAATTRIITRILVPEGVTA